MCLTGQVCRGPLNFHHEFTGREEVEEGGGDAEGEVSRVVLFCSPLIRSP